MNLRFRKAENGWRFSGGVRALSLPELLVTIAVVATLSAVSLQSYLGLRTSAREGVARDVLAGLNRAVLHFDQTNWDLVLNPVPDATSDELAILRTLQWRDPHNPAPGSPFVPANFSAAMSSSPDEFRLQWNGRVFELVPPGTSGSGLLVVSDGGTTSETYVFSDGYQPVGPGQHE